MSDTEEKSIRGIGIDTSVEFKDTDTVDSTMAEGREKLRKRISMSFDNLPDISTEKSLNTIEYIQKYPISLIVVPPKEFTLFPVLIDEAKKFLEESNYPKSPILDVMAGHEFDHGIS